MTGFTDTAARAILDAHVTAYPWLALFTTVGVDDGTGFTEVTGGSYARVDTTGLWAAATGSAPATKANNAALPFSLATAPWGTVIGVGLYTLSSGGVLGSFDYLGNFPWLPCNITNASPGAIITDRTHGMIPGVSCVYSTEYGGSVPSFAQSNLTGTLTVAHAASTVIDVTNSGIQVNTSGVGAGAIRSIVPQTINLGQNFTVNAGDLTISLA